MKMRFVLATLLTVATLQASANELNCVDFFSAPAAAPQAPEPSTVTLPLRAMNLTFEPGAPSRSESLSQLLEMYLAVPSQAEGLKDFEKDELTLGRALPHGETLLLSYRADERTDKKIFRLVEIERVYQSGHSELLEKRPLTDDGMSLRMQELALTRSSPDGTENTRYEPVAIPVEIKGPILKSLEEWIKLFPHVSRIDGRRSIAQIGSLFPTVYLKAKSKSLILKLAKSIKNKPAQLLFYALILVTFQQIPYVGDLIQDVPGFGKVKHLLDADKGETAKAQTEILKAVLSSKAVSKAGTMREAFVIEKRFSKELTKEKAEGSDETMRSILQVTGSLANRELAAGGKPVAYTETVKNPRVNTGDLKNTIESAGQRSVAVEYYERQHTIVLIPIVNVGKNGAAASMIEISAEDFPNTYSGLAAMLRKHLDK